MPPSAPPKLVCYSCGDEFGFQSLPIHQRTCGHKRQKLQSSWPEEWRRPQPLPPDSQRYPLPTKSRDPETKFQTYNSEAWRIYSEEGCHTTCGLCGYPARSPEQWEEHLQAHERDDQASVDTSSKGEAVSVGSSIQVRLPSAGGAMTLPRVTPHDGPPLPDDIAPDDTAPNDTAPDDGSVITIDDRQWQVVRGGPDDDDRMRVAPPPTSAAAEEDAITISRLRAENQTLAEALADMQRHSDDATTAAAAAQVALAAAAAAEADAEGSGAAMEGSVELDGRLEQLHLEEGVGCTEETKQVADGATPDELEMVTLLERNLALATELNAARAEAAHAIEATAAVTHASSASAARLSALLAATAATAAHEEEEGAKAWEEVRKLRSELAAMRAAASNAVGAASEPAGTVVGTAGEAGDASAGDASAGDAAARDAAARDAAARDAAAGDAVGEASTGDAEATNVTMTKVMDEKSDANEEALEQERSVGEAEVEAFTLNTPHKESSEGGLASGGEEGEGGDAIKFDSSYMFKDTEGDRIRVSQFE